MRSALAGLVAMTPRERLLAVMRRRKPDRVPLHLPGFDSYESLDSVRHESLREIAERALPNIAHIVGVPNFMGRDLVTDARYKKTIGPVGKNGEFTMTTSAKPLTWESRSFPPVQVSNPGIPLRRPRKDD